MDRTDGSGSGAATEEHDASDDHGRKPLVRVTLAHALLMSSGIPTRPSATPKASPASLD